MAKSPKTVKGRAQETISIPVELDNGLTFELTLPKTLTRHEAQVIVTHVIAHVPRGEFRREQEGLKR